MIAINNTYRPSWIHIYGKHFVKGQYIMCGWQHDDLPQFARIKDIILVVEYPLLILDTFITQGINNHLSSYLIKGTRHVFIFRVSSLLVRDTFMAHTYPGDGQLYIAMKYHVERTD